MGGMGGYLDRDRVENGVARRRDRRHHSESIVLSRVLRLLRPPLLGCLSLLD